MQAFTTKIDSTVPGIQRDKKIVVKLMYIPNVITQITPSLDFNKWLKRLDTQLNKIIKIS